MLWWVWMLLGLALLGLEILTPGGFYVLFFGIGAVAVGVLAGLGVAGPPWSQWLLFSVVSVVSLALFRGRLLRRMNPPAPPAAIDTLEGELAILLEDIAPGAFGKAELRGTAWSARNADDRILAHGQRCRVTRVDGLTITVRAE
ncbi:MAG: NfeD family protein [Candidatus Rokubacteria bacterium]|nr:NfeD family protein [Candidatus Rokubacteria bacterium]